MDHITDAMEMVDHLDHPAFCVRDGIIIKVNPAGAAQMIEPGTAVSDILQTGQEEYSEFRSGCLYLTLCLCGEPTGASVTAKNGFHLFILEPESEQSELRTLALAARELRDPLSGIMFATDRLLPGILQENEENRELIAGINRALFQLHRLVNNMSDASHFCIDSGARQEVRDIRGIVCETVTKAQNLAEATGIHMTFDAYPEPVFGLVDEAKLERAILNIISNAVKFTPGGGTVHVSLSRRNNKLYLRIQDSGCGIAEPLRGSIFSRYTRELGLEDGRHGVGLGMVIIRSTAALHGGTVLVDHPGEAGTRITMTIAIRESSGNALRSPVLKVDYAGERDHGLLELADVLPTSLYDPKKIN